MRLIRSRARRRGPNIGRKRASPETQSQLLSHSQAVQYSSNNVSRSAATEVARHLLERRSWLNSVTASNTIDPFDTLRIGEAGKSHFLISQCKQATPYSTPPASTRGWHQSLILLSLGSNCK
jgi:hypothetical protein